MGQGGGAPSVTMKPAAARRLGLVLDGKRWRVRADPPHPPRGPLARGSNPADHRTAEPWVIVAEAEAPSRAALTLPVPPPGPRPVGPMKSRPDPRPVRNSFDLRALRARLEAAEVRRREGAEGPET